MEPITTTTFFTTLLNILLNVFQVFLVGIASWAAMWIGKKFQNENLSKELEKDLQDVIRVSINKAKLNVENPATPEKNINLKHDIINKSLQEIKTIKPKTLKKLKLTDVEIENRIKSYVLSEDNIDIKKVKEWIVKDYDL